MKPICSRPLLQVAILMNWFIINLTHFCDKVSLNKLQLYVYVLQVVFCPLFFWSLCCLSFNLLLLVTPFDIFKLFLCKMYVPFWVCISVMTLWSLLCFILFINLASKTVMIIMKLTVIVVIYCLQRYIFQQTGLSIEYMFCKSNGHIIYSSSHKLGK